MSSFDRGGGAKGPISTTMTIRPTGTVAAAVSRGRDTTYSGTVSPSPSSLIENHKVSVLSYLFYHLFLLIELKDIANQNSVILSMTTNITSSLMSASTSPNMLSITSGLSTK